MKDLSRLCIHTITTKPWDFETAVKAYHAAGIRGITIWQDAIAGRDPLQVKALLDAHDMEVVSYCRGGFFPHPDPEQRQQALETNRKMIREAGGIGAPLLVLVCGAHQDQTLEQSRAQIQAGIEELIPLAAEQQVKLAIEPLHPMYADTRSAINTLKQANDMAAAIDSPWVGVAVDVYHLWWDPDLEKEIYRCGKLGKLLAYHICDWRVPTEDLLLDREIMGKGCVPLKEIGQWVQKAGFGGFEEVEIFSTRYWAGDQQTFLEEIIEAYLAI